MSKFPATTCNSTRSSRSVLIHIHSWNKKGTNYTFDVSRLFKQLLYIVSYRAGFVFNAHYHPTPSHFHRNSYNFIVNNPKNVRHLPTRRHWQDLHITETMTPGWGNKLKHLNHVIIDVQRRNWTHRETCLQLQGMKPFCSKTSHIQKRCSLYYALSRCLASQSMPVKLKTAGSVNTTQCSSHFQISKRGIGVRRHNKAGIATLNRKQSLFLEHSAMFLYGVIDIQQETS